MSKRLQVSDTLALAFGFSWQALDPVESRSGKLAELLAQGNRWQVSFKTKRTEYLGVSKDDFTPLPKIKTVSGAALMANHPKLAGQTLWIVMEEPLAAGPEIAEAEGKASEKPGHQVGPMQPVEAGRVSQIKMAQSEMVVVGLLNGNIVIDDYVNKAGYQKQMAAFIERCSKAKAKYTTVGTSYTLGAVSQTFTWDDFLPTKANKGVPVRTLEPSMHARVLVGAGLVAAALGVVWVYVAWDNEQKAEAERLRRAQAARNIPALYTASITQILGKPVLRANAVFAELRDKLRSFPIRLAGWNFKRIECKAETGTCVATWTNNAGAGTNRGFAAAAPSSWGTVNFDVSGKSLTHALPFTLTKSPLPARETWPQARDFLLKQFSQWQSYWIVGFEPSLASAPQIVGLVSGVDAQSAADLPDATWATAWSIAKTDWHLSEGFDTSPEKGDANLPDSVTVESITLEMDNNRQLKFDANGLIYERK